MGLRSSKGDPPCPWKKFQCLKLIFRPFGTKKNYSGKWPSLTLPPRKWNKFCIAKNKNCLPLAFRLILLKISLLKVMIWPDETAPQTTYQQTHPSSKNVKVITTLCTERFRIYPTTHIHISMNTIQFYFSHLGKKRFWNSWWGNLIGSKFNSPTN